MIKKCKITNIINGVIYGVTKEPIKNNAIVELNSGQIMSCLIEANVDEILSDGTLVRLNKSNYTKNNESQKVYIKDEVVDNTNTKLEQEESKEAEQEANQEQETVKEIAEEPKEEEKPEQKQEEKRNNNLKKKK